MIKRPIPGIQDVGQRQDGDSMIETALVLPPFFLLLFGIFSFSMLMVSYASATYCLRGAARYGSMHSQSSMSPASALYLSNLVTNNTFIYSGSSPVVSVSYYTYTGASSGNFVGNILILKATWTQNVSIPFYSNTIALQTQTYRMITE